MRNKKGQGLIMGLVMGVAALVITVIIAFVIVSNVATVESDIATTVPGSPIINESGNVNATAYTLAKASLTGFTNPVITRLYNETSGLEFDVGNASVTSAGVVTNSTTGADGYVDALISYTYDYGKTTISTRDLRANFTSGIDKVSSKIPTVLLIAAVVLVLGILVLLWTQYKRMDIGGSGGEGGL